MGILRPRTIRGQLMGGLILFEIIVLAILSALVIHEQREELRTRTDQRLEYQASLIAGLSGTALEDKQYATLERIMSVVQNAPRIRSVRITDMQGRTLVSSGADEKGRMNLSQPERVF